MACEKNAMVLNQNFTNKWGNYINQVQATNQTNNILQLKTNMYIYIYIILSVLLSGRDGCCMIRPEMRFGLPYASSKLWAFHHLTSQ